MCVYKTMKNFVSNILSKVFMFLEFKKAIKRKTHTAKFLVYDLEVFATHKKLHQRNKLYSFKFTFNEYRRFIFYYVLIEIKKQT